LPGIAGYCVRVRVKLRSSGVRSPWVTRRRFLCRPHPRLRHSRPVRCVGRVGDRLPATRRVHVGRLPTPALYNWQCPLSISVEQPRFEAPIPATNLDPTPDLPRRSRPRRIAFEVLGPTGDSASSWQNPGPDPGEWINLLERGGLETSSLQRLTESSWCRRRSRRGHRRRTRESRERGKRTPYATSWRRVPPSRRRGSPTACFARKRRAVAAPLLFSDRRETLPVGVT
jgi:hypothetical protein